MKVIPLGSIEEFERYVNFAEDVYSDNPYWVPTDPDHLVHLLAGNKEAGPHWLVQPFWVEDNGRILATVTAVIDATYNSRWNEHTGHLIFFEALPDVGAAVDLLLREACDWLRGQGCNKSRMSMLLGWQIPWTIDAYTSVPTVFHTYNPPYYHGYGKSSGFSTETGMVQYQVTFTPELADRYRQMVSKVTQSGVVLRNWDLSKLESETELFTELWNETFSNHWGAGTIPVQQMQGLTVGLSDFLIPDFLVFAEVEGRPAGVVYAVPDLNQSATEIDHGCLLIIGVREEFRGRGINLGMAAMSYLAMIDRGYRMASYTVVLDDNWPSRRTAEKLGCRVTRNFNVYAKEL